MPLLFLTADISELSAHMQRQTEPSFIIQLLFTLQHDSIVLSSLTTLHELLDVMNTKVISSLSLQTMADWATIGIS